VPDAAKPCVALQANVYPAILVPRSGRIEISMTTSDTGQGTMPAGSADEANSFWLFPVEEGALLVHRDMPEMWVLNSSALCVWRGVLAGLGADSIAQDLAGTYGIDIETARRDTHAALSVFHRIIGVRREPGCRQPHGRRLAGAHRSISRTYEINGQLFRITSHGGATNEILPRFEPHQSNRSDPPAKSFDVLERSGSVSIAVNGRIAACESGQVTSVALQRLISQHCLGTRRWDACFHGGAIANGRGCIVLAGASGSGKSTLIAHLTSAGFRLVSDDLCGFDAKTGLISGLPLAIKLREGSWPILERSCAGLAVAANSIVHGNRSRFWFPPNGGFYSSVPARALAFIRYSADEDRARLRRLTVLESLCFLQTAGFWIQRRRRTIQRLLDWLSRIPSYELVFPDHVEATAILKSWILP